MGIVMVIPVTMKRKQADIGTGMDKDTVSR